MLLTRNEATLKAIKYAAREGRIKLSCRSLASPTVQCSPCEQDRLGSYYYYIKISAIVGNKRIRKRTLDSKFQFLPWLLAKKMWKLMTFPFILRERINFSTRKKKSTNFICSQGDFNSINIITHLANERRGLWLNSFAAMPRGKEHITKEYAYKLDIDNCINVLLFYQNLETSKKIRLIWRILTKN